MPPDPQPNPNDLARDEAFVRLNGPLSDCETQEEKEYWLESFGAFALGWEQATRLHQAHILLLKAVVKNFVYPNSAKTPEQVSTWLALQHFEEEHGLK